MHYDRKVYLRRDRGPSVDVAAGWFVSWLVVCETLDTETVIALRKKGHPRYENLQKKKQQTTSLFTYRVST